MLGRKPGSGSGSEPLLAGGGGSSNRAQALVADLDIYIVDAGASLQAFVQAHNSNRPDKEVLSKQTSTGELIERARACVQEIKSAGGAPNFMRDQFSRYEAKLRDITRDFEGQQQTVQRQRLLQPTTSSSSSTSAAEKPPLTSQDHLKIAKQAQAESMASLARSAKLVEDTTVARSTLARVACHLTLRVQVLGTETAVKLHGQTEQMKNIYSTVSELDSELGRANKVLRSFIRGAMTDKLTLCFILLLICGIISVIVVKVVNNQPVIPSSTPAPPTPAPPTPTPPPSPTSSPPVPQQFGVSVHGNKLL